MSSKKRIKKRIKKIKVEAAKSTPISTFRERYRDESKQITLTQLLGSNSGTDDDFIDNRKRSAGIKEGRKNIIDLFESSNASNSESDTPAVTIVNPPKKPSSRRIKSTKECNLDNSNA